MTNNKKFKTRSIGKTAVVRALGVPQAPLIVAAVVIAVSCLLVGVYEARDAESARLLSERVLVVFQMACAAVLTLLASNRR